MSVVYFIRIQFFHSNILLSFYNPFIDAINIIQHIFPLYKLLL